MFGKQHERINGVDQVERKKKDFLWSDIFVWNDQIYILSYLTEYLKLNYMSGSNFLLSPFELIYRTRMRP